MGTKTFWFSLTSATREIVKLRRSLLRHNTEKPKLLGISHRDTTLLQPVTRTKAQSAYCYYHEPAFFGQKHMELPAEKLSNGEDAVSLASALTDR